MNKNNIEKRVVKEFLEQKREKPIVCVPIMGDTKEEIVGQVQECAEKGIEAIEWRLDAFEGLESPNAIREVLRDIEPFMENIMFIYTLRTKPQGGMVELTDDQIKEIHSVATEFSIVDFIDIECFSVENVKKEIDFLRKKNKKVIISHHEFNETPNIDILENIFIEMFSLKADAVKIAVMPSNAEDVLKIFELTYRVKSKYPNIPLITISMGKLGVISRIAGGVFGSSLTFGTVRKESAPGQIEVEKLEKIMNVIY